MVAAALSERYKNFELKIRLIESDSISSVGVGEATVPGIIKFHQHLNIREQDFIRATDATFKLGIEFKNWYKKAHRFFHPFAAFGDVISGQDFYQCWLKLHKEGIRYPLEDFCLAINLAKKGKFAQPDDNATTRLALYSYAYHFDASRYAVFLRDYAQARGVERIEGKVANVTQNENGNIKALILEDEREIDGDLFIDCSGFRALLIEQTLHTGFDNWSHWLPCDHAVTVQSDAMKEPSPYTRSTALPAGWQWRIPLQHRVGNGYVYCSKFATEVEAKNALLNNIEGEALTEIRKIAFETGMRKKFWNKNCVALGLASGFIEPLESTSISLIQTGIEKLMQFMPNLEIKPGEVDEANRLNKLEYERIRDFIVLHYKSSQRTDSEFWRYVRTMSIPETLSEKIRRFSNDGTVLLGEQESFTEQSWIAMYNGFKRIPRKCQLSESLLSSDKLKIILDSMRHAISKGADYAPTHADFLKDVYAK